MVDVVVNNVMALSTTPDLSTYMFKDKVWTFIFYSGILTTELISSLSL